MGLWYGAGATRGVTSPAAHRGKWHSAGATKSWFSVLSVSCSWLVSVIFGQLPFHSVSRPLFRKLKKSSTKCQSLWKIEVTNPSFNDFAVSSQHLLSLFAVLSLSVSRVHSFTLSAVSLSICQSKIQLQKAFSLRAGARTLSLTTSIGIWHSAGVTKGGTSPAAHKGIWHGAGATRSWLHSPSWSKSFVVIKKSQLNRNFLSR